MSPGSSTFSSYCCCALISVTTVALILSSGLFSTAGALSLRSTYNCQKAMCNYGLMECSCQWHTSLDLQSRQYSPHPKFQTSHYPCTTRDFEEAMEKLRPFITSLGSDLAETCYDSNESPLLRAKRKTKPSHKPSRKKKHVSLPASEHPLSKSRKFYDDAFLYVVKIKKNKSAKKFTNFGGEVTTTLQPSTDFDATTALTVSDNGTDMESENRSRRSIPISSGDVWSAFSKPKGVTWRLDTAYSDPSGLLTAAVQRDIITQALGTWERSSNLCFREDTTSQSVNFVIQFRPAIHGFHNFAGTPAHTKSKQYIHLNRDFQWKLDARSTNGANSAVLRTVLEHEIGHLSGMSHSSSSAVMASNYNTQGDPSILSDSDLIELKSTYGRCTGKFYTLIDVQWRTVYPDGNIGLFYRSLITKETLVWQYSNQEGRPTDGYPTQVDLEFPSFLGTPTAVFQVYTYEAPKYIDDVFLIRGNFYQKYISKSHGLTYTGESGTVSKFDIPNSASVDAAVYDTRTERILFFVSSNVYEVEPVYNANGFVSSYRRTGTFTIAQMFPAAAGQNTGYMSGIDAVYIHVTGKMYLLKGLNIWRNVGFSLTGKVTNSIQYLGTQSDSNNDHLWDFLCNPFTCKSG